MLVTYCAIRAKTGKLVHAMRDMLCVIMIPGAVRTPPSTPLKNALAFFVNAIGLGLRQDETHDGG